MPPATTRVPSALLVLCLLGTAASAPAATIVVTEWMYDSRNTEGGEFVELTNVGAAPVDMNGWSFDDDHRQPHAFDLSALGVVVPGQSVVIAEEEAPAFRAAWALASGVAVAGGLGVASGNNLGRNDEINIYDGAGVLVDRLRYGDQTFPGTLRARFASGNPGSGSAVGADTVAGWIAGQLGDDLASVASSAGDIGNPGSFLLPGGAASGPVSFTPGGGMYASARQVSLSATDGAVIRYTLDGSTPHEGSPIYTGPIAVESREGDPNYFSHIPTTHGQEWRLPADEVFKGTVVRAAAFRAGATPGPVATHTYFVDADIQSRYTLPVISIATDEDDLWGYERGIYVPGKIYDDNYDPDLISWMRPANYTQRGDEWERRASMELFETDGTLRIRQDVGVRINGEASREARNKALRIYARAEFGADALRHAFFPGDPLDEFQRVVLRTGGNDRKRGLFRDDLQHRLIAPTGLGHQASQPAIVFLNGEYWGIHMIRDRIDQYFLASRFGADPDAVDLISDDVVVEEGSATHFLALRDFIFTQNLQIPANYSWVTTQMDVADYVTYFAAQIYFRNTDWPRKNIDYWRPRTPEGRWRWIVHDTDFGFGWVGGADAYEYDSLHRVAVSNYEPNSVMFQRLLTNADFRAQFILRYAELLNTVFLPEAVLAHIDALHSELAPEIGEHITRWRAPAGNGAWNVEVEIMREFARRRPEYARTHVVEQFDLAGTARIGIDNPTPERGRVRIGGIEPPAASMPWSGVYFQGVPVSLAGLPSPGYRFRGFTGLPPGGSGNAVLVPSGDVSLAAVFVEAGAPAVCGDGFRDGGEVCDTAGNTAACDADCTLPDCGDGLLNASAGEQCDDGTGTGTDGCCSPGCVHSAGGLPCDDGDACTTGEICSAGVCSGALEPSACMDSYLMRKSRGGVRETTVIAEDVLEGSSTVELTGVESAGLPAATAGAGLVRDALLLDCSKASDDGRASRRGRTVTSTTSLGAGSFTLTGNRQLCASASGASQAPVPVPTSPPWPSLMCYEVRSSEPLADVTFAAADRFASEQFALRRPVAVCVPSAVDEQAPVQNPAVGLQCHQIKRLSRALTARRRYQMSSVVHPAASERTIATPSLFCIPALIAG